MKEQLLKIALTAGLCFRAKVVEVRRKVDRLKRFSWLVILLPSLASALGHDRYGITTKIYLRSNSLELRADVAAKTMVTLMAADGELDWEITQKFCLPRIS